MFMAMLFVLMSLGLAGEGYSEDAHAEHIQLYEGMRKLASLNNWDLVEADYQRLLELSKDGERLTYEIIASAPKRRVHAATCSPAANDSRQRVTSRRPTR
jgi:hypothetical protein